MINPEDLIAYHKKFFVPNNIIIGVTGDFKRDELLAQLKALTGDWVKSETLPPPPPEVQFNANPGVFEVVKDINQPRYPTIMGIRRASRAQIPTWTAGDLDQKGVPVMSAEVMENAELSMEEAVETVKARLGPKT